MPAATRRLLLVTQRPLDYGGGGSVRWQFLRDELPRHGWQVEVVSSAGNASANEISTDPAQARLAARRAQVMRVAGAVLDPLARVAHLQPEALAPNNAWALTGRRAVRTRLAGEHIDAVVATCPPPSALLAAAPAAAAGVPLVADFRDLWAGNPLFDRGSELLRRVQGRALRRAGAVVTVTDGFRRRLTELHPELDGEIVLIPNGFDPALLEHRRNRTAAVERSQGAPVLIHAGALYGDRSAAGLIDALGRPEVGRDVRLRLIGTIDPETRAVAQRAPRGVQVTLEPPVPWGEAVDATAAADVAVVLNTPGIGGDLMVPGKLYEALALGRPVLAVTPPRSEVARIMESLGQGAGIAPVGDAAAIAAAAARLMTAPPPPVPPEQLRRWDRAHGAQVYAELLDRLVAERVS